MITGPYMHEAGGTDNDRKCRSWGHGIEFDLEFVLLFSVQLEH
jgi:hypothetical protein